MNKPMPKTSLAPAQISPRVTNASYVIAAGLLIGSLFLHLIPALFAGMVTYLLIQLLAPLVPRSPGLRGKVVVVALIVLVVVTIIGGLGAASAVFLRREEGLSVLFEKMAKILSDASGSLPSWIVGYLPTNAQGFRAAVVGWLNEHSAEMRLVGKEAGVAFAHIIIGIVLGAIVAFRDATFDLKAKPLAAALIERAYLFADAFRRVVFAQVRISLINTVITAIYLLAILPAFDIHLTFRKTIIALTFIVGLLPVVGNLISNTVIIIVSFSHSLAIALASLAYLVTIHKLEYFLNAKIVGTQIKAQSWELLLAMLLLEALFGLPGLAAAPIFYAYLKCELVRRDLI